MALMVRPRLKTARQAGKAVHAALHSRAPDWNRMFGKMHMEY